MVPVKYALVSHSPEHIGFPWPHNTLLCVLIPLFIYLLKQIKTTAIIATIKDLNKNHMAAVVLDTYFLLLQVHTILSEVKEYLESEEEMVIMSHEITSVWVECIRLRLKS